MVFNSKYIGGLPAEAVSQYWKGRAILLNNYKLEPLTDYERKFATENHNLVYSFLHRYGYSVEMYYDIAIFGYLKAVQIYNRREDLQNKYAFPFISQQYMRSEIGNHLRIKNAKKRKPSETVVSLDAEYSETDNLYNCVGNMSGNFPESEILELERLTEFLDNLSDTQRKIAQMKLDGYNNKEIYLSLEIRRSSFYMEMKRIRKVLAEMIG